MGYLQYNSNLGKVLIPLEYNKTNIIASETDTSLGHGSRSVMDLVDTTFGFLLGAEHFSNKYIKDFVLNMDDIQLQEGKLNPIQDDFFVVNFFNKETNISYIEERLSSPTVAYPKEDVSYIRAPKKLSKGSRFNEEIAPFKRKVIQEEIEKLNAITQEFYPMLSFSIDAEGELKVQKGSKVSRIATYLGVHQYEQFIALASILLTYGHLSPVTRFVYMIDAMILRPLDVKAISKLCEVFGGSKYLLIFFGMPNAQVQKGVSTRMFNQDDCYLLMSHRSFVRALNTKLSIY